MKTNILYIFAFLLSFQAAGQANSGLDTSILPMTQYSTLSDANASGLQGIRFGSGVSGSGGQEERQVYKMFLTKGLFWPFTAGLSYSSLENSPLRAIGGHLKYSFLQRFRWPSLATSLHYSRLVGEDKLAFGSNYGINAHFSWGFRFASLIGKWTAEKQNFSKRTDEAAFTATEEEKIVDQVNYSQTLGLHLQIIPHFVILAMEQINPGRESDSYYQAALKVGF